MNSTFRNITLSCPRRQEDRTHHKHSCENLRPYKNWYVLRISFILYIQKAAWIFRTHFKVTEVFYSDSNYENDSVS
jgi:hypothetical protein